MAIRSHLRCDQVVERASDYLERALASGDAEQLEQHLVLCRACADYVEQLRSVIEAAGRLRSAGGESGGASSQAIDPGSLEQLLQALRRGAGEDE